MSEENANLPSELQDVLDTWTTVAKAAYASADWTLGENSAIRRLVKAKQPEVT